MTRTKIEWATHTTNPLRARKLEAVTGQQALKILATGHYCEKVSEECRNCYASKWQPRFGMPEFAEQRRMDNIEVYLDEAELTKILKHRKPARIFWNDMSDWAGHWVRDEWIYKMLAVVALTPHITHMWLTKRSKRMRELLTATDLFDRVRIACATMPGVKPEFEFPLLNLSLGVSVGTPEAKSRIDDLRETPAAVRFLSCEPLLADLGTLDLRGINWVITGGESGNRARPSHPDWFRSLRDQCQAAGVRYFHKQWGEWAPTGPEDAPDIAVCAADGWSGPNFRESLAEHANKAHGGEIECPPFQRMYRVTNAKAGRLLDGRTWDELPEVNS